MSAPRQSQSLRTLIALSLLACFSKGNHGPTAKIVEEIEAEGYNPNTLKVQIAQVRNGLLKLMGIEVPEAKGKLTPDQKTALDRRLANPFVKAKAKRLKGISSK